MALIPWRNQAKRRLNFIKSESEPILHAEQQFETSVMIAVVVLTALLALISGRRTEFARTWITGEELRRRSDDLCERGCRRAHYGPLNVVVADRPADEAQLVGATEVRERIADMPAV